jgi:tRNA A37 methylthiotransferase MiaB
MENAAIFKLLNKTYSFPRLIEMSREMNYPVVSPAVASINITSRCNSRCCYCDIGKVMKALVSLQLRNFACLRNPSLNWG